MELKEEAFGFGLHPWEFYEYTLEEFMLRRSGVIKARRMELQQDFQHIRILASYMITPYLNKKDKDKTLDQLVPDIYDCTPKESPKSVLERVTEKYKKLGILK